MLPKVGKNCSVLSHFLSDWHQFWHHLNIRKGFPITGTLVFSVVETRGIEPLTSKMRKSFLRLSCWCMWVGKMNQTGRIRPKIRPKILRVFQINKAIYMEGFANIASQANLIGASHPKILPRINHINDVDRFFLYQTNTKSYGAYTQGLCGNLFCKAG